MHMLVEFEVKTNHVLPGKSRAFQNVRSIFLVPGLRKACNFGEVSFVSQQIGWKNTWRLEEMWITYNKNTTQKVDVKRLLPPIRRKKTEKKTKQKTPKSIFATDLWELLEVYIVDVYKRLVVIAFKNHTAR